MWITIRLGYAEWLTLGSLHATFAFCNRSCLLDWLYYLARSLWIVGIQGSDIVGSQQPYLSGDSATKIIEDILKVLFMYALIMFRSYSTSVALGRNLTFSGNSNTPLVEVPFRINNDRNRMQMVSNVDKAVRS